MSNKLRRKKTLARQVGNAVFYLLLIAAIGAAFFVSRSGEGVSGGLGGFHVLRILSPSMQSVYPVGSVVVVRSAPAGDYKVGDDVTYLREDDQTVTHRIISIIDNAEGSGLRGFETKGVENQLPDFEIVYENNVLGRVMFHIPAVGSAAEFLQANWAWALALLAILLALSFTLPRALRPAKISAAISQAKGGAELPS
ncbi:MAG: signal peptidase I [Oscillospiraceae bacterium]|jgi:signal peptidase|nr:signal peptidase I [Oscillospiraceae bacterium]